MTNYPPALQRYAKLSQYIRRSGTAKSRSALRSLQTFPTLLELNGAMIMIEAPLALLWISEKSDVDLRIYNARRIVRSEVYCPGGVLKIHQMNDVSFDKFDEITLANARHIAKIEHSIFLRIVEKRYRSAKHPLQIKQLPISSEVMEFILSAEDRADKIAQARLPLFETLEILHDCAIAASLKARLGIMKPKWRRRAAELGGATSIVKQIEACASVLEGQDRAVSHLKHILANFSSKERRLRWSCWYANDCLDDALAAYHTRDHATAFFCLSDALKHAAVCLTGARGYLGLQEALAIVTSSIDPMLAKQIAHAVGEF